MAQSTSIDRRKFLAAAGCAALTLAACGAGPVESPGNSRRPNILLVMTDDQGWGDLSAHGNAVLQTPVLDSLAESGARFERFFVDPVCAPTRAALLTGRYPFRSGVSGVTRGRETMRLNEVTIADIFQRAGYATGCFGKWHNGAHYPYHPLGRGFDRFVGFCAGHWNNYFDTTLDRDGSLEKTSGYITDVLTDEAISFIESNRKQPFFCYLPYNAPHSPFQVPDRYFDKYSQMGLGAETACVYGMVENLDDNLGRLLKTLARLDLERDTIVVFLTDNGANTERFNAGLRGYKGSMHEGGVRVPCFMRWTGTIAPGTTVHRLAAHIDLLPTLASLAGVDYSGTLPLDGENLKNSLLGKKEVLPTRKIFHGFSNRGAVRTDSHRLVLQDGQPTGLFMILHDEAQKNNVLEQQPQKAKELTDTWNAWYKDVTSDGLVVPPIPVGYAKAPTTTLPGHEAHLSGSLHYNGKSGWANDWVEGWDGQETSLAAWNLNVIRPGEYKMSILYVCPEHDVGTNISIEAGGGQTGAAISKAHYPDPIPSPDRVPRREVYEKEWATQEIGNLKLPAGKTDLKLGAIPPSDQSSKLEIKAVRITKVNVT